MMTITTQHRFIFPTKHGFNVHVPKPSGGKKCTTVSRKHASHETLLVTAISVRNKIGAELWGPHWQRLLDDENLLRRLPVTLEPVTCSLSRGKLEGRFYLATWSDGQGNQIKTQYSINKYGRIGAYCRAKADLIDAYRDVIELLVYMGRVSIEDLTRLPSELA